MLIGHHSTQSQLAQLLASGRFPHAVLLHGPQGIGKRKLAELLTTRLICGPAVEAEPEPDSFDMFGETQNAKRETQNAAGQGPLAFNTSAPAYHQMLADSCPDYHILQPDEGKKSIGIKQVQSLLEVLLRSADTARTVIVDSLEALTPEAANTLLKTLEEPRPGIFFVLLAHQLTAVLPTIRSRCRLVPMQPLSLAETTTVLEELKEDASLAPIANGAPGSVMGKEAKARAEALLALKNGTKPATSTPAFVSTLMQHMATQTPTLGQAETYFKLAALQRDAADKNLPAALTAESALTKYQTLNTKN